MNKGGDQTTSTTTGDLPEWYKTHATGMLDRAKTISNQPYVPYQNERLADFSADTNASFDMVRDQAAAGSPGLDAAQATAGGIAGYQSQGIPDMNMSAYMNPYISNVLDVQKQRANQTFAEQQAGRNAAAVSAGAFGGDRRFVQDSLAQRDLNQQLQGIEAEGLSSAFDRATGLFQTDETNRRLGAGLGLEAAGLQGNLAQQAQDMGWKNAEALSGVGAKIQQRDQAGLDLAYQDFTAQRNYPKEQLAFYNSILTGQPVQQNTSTTVTEPAPDFLSQLLGLAVGGAGIWDLFN